MMSRVFRGGVLSPVRFWGVNEKGQLRTASFSHSRLAKGSAFNDYEIIQSLGGGSLWVTPELKKAPCEDNTPMFM